MNLKWLLIVIIFLSTTANTNSVDNSEFCIIYNNEMDVNKNCGNNKYLNNNRYILYDVNPFEGFNLRRDVYIRVAVFIKKIVDNDKKYHWNLVLPPWNRLVHWRSQDIGEQHQIPWRLFFDIESLRQYIPVMDMEEFIKAYKLQNKNNYNYEDDDRIILDKIYILKNDPLMFETGNFTEKNEVKDCSIDNQNIQLYKKQSNNPSGYFWTYKNFTAKEIHCVTFHGSTSQLTANLNPILYSTYMFDHMEITLHDYYGSVDFWRARRSMRYNKELYEIANKFRAKYFNSADEEDKTVKPKEWQQEKKNRRDAIGGVYLSVHLRRRDFLNSHRKSIPTIKNAALQLNNKMKELNIDTLFVATDAPNYEFEELKKYLPSFKVFKYTPSSFIKTKFKDGGVAIIDQIICSHARYFIGTYESTFTFRIQEDREIMGFPTSTTFNRLCGEDECEPGSKWEIVW